MEALDSNYPQEIIYEILVRLPSKSLLRFKSVCKSWDSLISDPQFILSHQNFSIPRTKVFFRYDNEGFFGTLHYEDHEIHAERFHFPPEVYDVDVFGSCHGFVLLKEKSSCPNFYLWNPSVKKYTKLSCPFNFPTASTAGLCYDSSTDDYKIVAICWDCYYIYSLRKGCWGEGKLFSYSQACVSFISVFADGALHWVAVSLNQDYPVVPESEGILELDKEEEDYEYDPWCINEIICFDPEKENFSKVARPKFVGCCYMYCLAELGCRLGLYYHNHNKSKIKLWLRTGHNSNSWKKFVIISNLAALNRRGFITPLCYNQEGDILVHVDGQGCFIYDLKEEKFRKMQCEPHECCIGPLTTVTYVDSLLLRGVWERKWLKT